MQSNRHYKWKSLRDREKIGKKKDFYLIFVHLCNICMIICIIPIFNSRLFRLDFQFQLVFQQIFQSTGFHRVFFFLLLVCNLKHSHNRSLIDALKCHSVNQYYFFSSKNTNRCGDWFSSNLLFYFSFSWLLLLLLILYTSFKSLPY